MYETLPGDIWFSLQIERMPRRGYCTFITIAGDPAAYQYQTSSIASLNTKAQVMSYEDNDDHRRLALINTVGGEESEPGLME